MTPKPATNEFCIALRRDRGEATRVLPRRHRLTLGMGIFLILIGLPDADARAQIPKDQQKCIVELNKNFARVAKIQGKEIVNCLKDATKDALGDLTLNECVTRVPADPNAAPLPPGKVEAAMQKTIDKANKKCAGVSTTFGPSDPNAVNTIASAFRRSSSG